MYHNWNAKNTERQIIRQSETRRVIRQTKRQSNRQAEWKKIPMNQEIVQTLTRTKKVEFCQDEHKSKPSTSEKAWWTNNKIVRTAKFSSRNVVTQMKNTHKVEDKNTGSFTWRKTRVQVWASCRGGETIAQTIKLRELRHNRASGY